MDSRGTKLNLNCSTYLGRVKETVIKFKLHFLFLIVLTIMESGFQGKIISFKDPGEEMHLDIFRAQIKSFLRQDEPKEVYNIKLDQTLSLIHAFYNANRYFPAWTNNYALNKNAEDYISLLSNAHYYGLDSNDYYYGKLLKLKNDLYSEKNYIKLTQLRIETEIMLTNSCLRFSTALKKGILNERSANYAPDSIENMRLVWFLASSIKETKISEAILSLQPKSIYYVRLQKALEKFVKSTEYNHSIAEMPDAQKEPEVAKNIAREILLTFSFAKEIPNEEEFIIQLKKFQKLNNIEQSGELDKNTCRALNDLTLGRYQKVVINIERLRQEQWSDDVFILVNIPAFNMRIFESNMEVAVFKTIIGKPISPTPIFSGKIDKIVTNPCWIVPMNILKNELINKAKNDTTFLIRNNYLVFDENNNQVDPNFVKWAEVDMNNMNYRMIQESSEENALGKLKFLFPNKYSVYVHDTPSKRLFKNEYRAYSHGCVRVENPQILAEYIIKKQSIPNWDKHLKSNLSKGVQEIFNLKRPIDIHLRYFTCEADDSGLIYFYEDIYKKDIVILKQLKS